MRLVHALLLLVAHLNADAAPAPTLAKSPPPTICNPRAGEWRPTLTDIEKMEAAIPSYFRPLALNGHELPNPAHSYARHYTGIVRKGKKYIYGFYYPASDSWAPMIGKECAAVSDGGNSFWSLDFDPSTGKVVSLLVNGNA